MEPQNFLLDADNHHMQSSESVTIFSYLASLIPGQLFFPDNVFDTNCSLYFANRRLLHYNYIKSVKEASLFALMKVATALVVGKPAPSNTDVF